MRDAIPVDLPSEISEPLIEGRGVRIERIVSRGHVSPADFWYDQDEHEYVFVVQGAARIEIHEQGEVALMAGDWLSIPAHTRHRVAWTDPTSDTIWLAVFYSV